MWWQNILVAIIVAAALWVSLKRYAPRSIQKPMNNLHRMLFPRDGKIDEVQKSSGTCGDGCGACSGCHSSKKLDPEIPVARFETLRSK